MNFCKKIDWGYVIEPVFDQDKKFKGNIVKFTKPHRKWQEKVYCAKTNKMIPNPLFKEQ